MYHKKNNSGVTRFDQNQDLTTIVKNVRKWVKISIIRIKYLHSDLL